MLLDTLILRDGAVRLARPLHLDVSLSDDGFWYAFSPDLRAYGSGRTAPAAVEDLCETFWWVYSELNGTPLAELHESAVEFLSNAGEFIPSSVAA